MTSMGKLSKELQNQLVSEFHSGNMTCKAFCEKKGITFSSFKNFLYNSKRNTRNSSNTIQSFVPVVIDESITKNEEPGIKIIFKSGVSLVISNDFKEALLLKLINILS